MDLSHRTQRFALIERGVSTDQITHPALTVCWVTDLQAANHAEHREAAEAAQPEQDPTEGIEGADGLVEQPPARENLR